MYQSQIRRGEPIIDENNFHMFTDAPPSMSKGLIPRDKEKYPLGFSQYCKAARLEVPPRSEWPSLIEHREKTGTRISDRLIAANVPCLDQNGTSNCWANAPVHCVEILRCLTGLPHIPLSPAFIATKLSRYNGGMGVDAMEVLAELGAPPTSVYGANANRKSITQEVLDSAKPFKNIEWLDLPDSFDQMAAAILLHNSPCALGYNWWGHEVTGCDIVYLNGKFGIRIRNSWGMDYGDGKGFAVLMEGKGTPDDLECAMVTTASVGK